MRNLRVRFEIDINAIEHDPFPIRRGHRRADAFQLHHVFERERMLFAGIRRRGLRESRKGDDEKAEQKFRFHTCVTIVPLERRLCQAPCWRLQCLAKTPLRLLSFWEKSRSFLAMNSRTALVLALWLCACSAFAEKIVLTSGTVINPANNQILPDATVLIEGDRIVRVVAPPERLNGAKGARQIDCKGKFILPGYIDTHVHFFQSGDLFTRPDVVDLTKVRSYTDEVAWNKKNLPDTFARYLRCGITAVVDVGGPFWNFEVPRSGE